MAGLDSNVKLLLHFDGADGTTSTTDSSDSGHVITPVADAQIDTAQSKFGGSAALFDGAGDYYQIPDSTDWDLFVNTNNPFTIDCWIRFADTSAQGIIDQYEDSNNFWYLALSSNVLRFYSEIGGVAKLHISASWTPSTNTWYHIALVRSATTRFIFIDGVAQSLSGDSNVALSVISGNLRAGTNTVNNAFLNGWLDEFRISDVARWTSGFTPPTVEYSQSDNTGDVVFDMPLLWMNNPNTIQMPMLGVSSASGISGDMQLPLFGISAVGDNGVSTGDFDQSLPMLTVSATILMSNDVDITLPLLTVSSEKFVRGNGTITLPRFKFNTVAQQGSVHEVELTLPVLALRAFSGHPVGLTLPQFTIVAEGDNGLVGTFIKSLPRLVVNVKADQENIATFINSLPQFNFNLTGLQGIVSTSVSNRNLPMLDINAHAYKGDNGDVDITLPALTLITEVALNPNADLSQTLLMLTLDAYADVYINRII